MVDITIVFSRKVRNFLPRHSFVTIFNLFIRPLLDYGYVTFNRIYRSFIHQKAKFHSTLIFSNIFSQNKKEGLLGQNRLSRMAKI